ncbi:MAG: GntR family transcriptional regulator [Novosphingobium sp.]
MATAFDNKVQVQSLVDVVAERLETAIISGQLQPGSRLSEQALAASMGVSRGPLREAIRRLEGRKLLERTPNIGVRVAQLSLQDLNEILQVREALEGLACGLAALNMPDAAIAALDKMLDDHGKQKSVRENKGYYHETKNLDFHFSIIEGSGNERLTQMLSGDLHYLLRVYRHKASPRPGRAAQVLQEHRAIVSALKRRDPQAAEQAMREHLRDARRYLEEQIAAEEEKGEVAALPRKGRVGRLD